jgi:hypothetical protein
VSDQTAREQAIDAGYTGIGKVMSSGSYTVEKLATAAYDAMQPLIRQAVAEEIALLAEEWAAKTIDQRAAPAYEAMAEVARIVGRRS